MKDPTARWTNIDSVLAKEMINEVSEHQRHVNASKVSLYSWYMREDQWSMTGAAIQRSPDGKLLDGMHRLLAIIDSDTMQRMLVVDGIDESAFQHIDIGLPRSAKQFVNSPHRSSIAAAAQWLIHLAAAGGKATKSTGHGSPDIGEALAFIDDHPWMYDYADLVVRVQKSCGFSPAPHLALLTVVNDVSLIGPWIDALATGAGLDNDDPRLALRERWNREGDSLRAGGYINRLRRWIIIVKAWNAYVDNQPILQLKAMTNEKCPLIRMSQRKGHVWRGDSSQLDLSN